MEINTILVVDDEELMREMVVEMLEDRAENLIQAHSGEEALEMLAEEKKVDLVITDMKMPGMTGIQLVERVKAMNPSTPVVVMTGYSEIFTVEEAMKSGVDEYILKPFKKDEMNMLVTRAQWRASSIYKRRLLEDIKVILEYVTVANKVIATSGYPSPNKEDLMAMGERIRRSIAQSVTECLNNI